MKHLLYFVCGIITLQLFVRFYNCWEPKFTSKDPEYGGNRTDFSVVILFFVTLFGGIFVMYHLYNFFKFLLLLAHH